jgi:hypothetical protein
LLSQFEGSDFMFIRPMRRVVRRDQGSPFVPRVRSHSKSLSIEGLEPRLLLYAANGGVWPHRELVTVSFMPDGTDIGGVPNSLISSMNARFPTVDWRKEILRGAQSYAAVSNLNFSLASDDGSAFGSPGGSGTDFNSQGDSNFGDIRIGGFNLDQTLGISMLAPPVNGDTTAGDFFLNSATDWHIGSTFDLYTVAAHEAGHSVGLDHSLTTGAVMFPTYQGVRSGLAADDVTGIQSIYGVRAHDAFDASSPNNVKADATVITSYVDSNKQVSISSLDVTSVSDDDWYKIVTPSGSASTMTVKIQSTNLSLLAPKMTLYKGTTQKATVTGTYNSTISATETISSGQSWFIKVEGADTSVFGTGAYALQINMGTAVQPPVARPNTATAATGEGGFSSPLESDDGFEAASDRPAPAETNVAIATATKHGDAIAKPGVDHSIEFGSADRHHHRNADSKPTSSSGVVTWNAMPAHRTPAVDDLRADDLLDALLPSLI